MTTGSSLKLNCFLDPVVKPRDDTECVF
ncbi:MAG: palindromic element RPE4 domain-containing protein [Rickettsia sp.]